MTPFFLGLIPVDFFILLALMFLVVVLLMGWMNANEKCNRLREAVQELEKIQSLSAEALQERSAQKVEQVNDLIGTWDQAHTEEVGEPVAKLNLKAASQQAQARRVQRR